MGLESVTKNTTVKELYTEQKGFFCLFSKKMKGGA